MKPVVIYTVSGTVSAVTCDKSGVTDCIARAMKGERDSDSEVIKKIEDWFATHPAPGSSISVAGRKCAFTVEKSFRS